MDVAPGGFLRPGDADPFEGVDPGTVRFGWLDRYRVVYEGDDAGWSAYLLDVPGLIAAGESRAEVEQLLRAALHDHLALPDAPATPGQGALP